MTGEQANHSVPVLDYDARPAGSDVAKWVRRIFIVVICGMFGGVMGRAGATSYTASGYMQLIAISLNTAAMSGIQAQHVAAITSPANLAAAASNLRVTSVRPMTSADIAAALHVRPVPQSMLIAISFDDDDPGVAVAVTRAVMNSYAGSNSGAGVFIYPTTPTAPSHRGAFFAYGFAIGAAMGAVILALRWK